MVFFSKKIFWFPMLLKKIFWFWWRTIYVIYVKFWRKKNILTLVLSEKKFLSIKQQSFTLWNLATKYKTHVYFWINIRVLWDIKIVNLPTIECTPRSSVGRALDKFHQHIQEKIEILFENCNSDKMTLVVYEEIFNVWTHKYNERCKCNISKFHVINC